MKKALEQVEEELARLQCDYDVNCEVVNRAIVERNAIGKKLAKLRDKRAKMLVKATGVNKEFLWEVRDDLWSSTYLHELLDEWYKDTYTAEISYGDLGYRDGTPDLAIPSDDDFNGYYPIPRVSLKKGQDIGVIPHDLRKIAALIDEEMLIIDVREHTLSEHGVYNIRYRLGDDHASLVKTTYGVGKTLDQAGHTLESVLKHCAKYHYSKDDNSY
jgi:hypothetical protein